MAPQVHHRAANSSSYSHSSSKRETFTIWMKSLVLQGHGCTVYDQNGKIVYRIDNYDKMGSNEVYLMDLHGKVLYTILRRVRVFGRWRGYKNDGMISRMAKRNPSFLVTKSGHVSFDHQGGCYKLEGSSDGELGLKIIDGSGGVVAEAKRKESSKGVVLGEGVLSLVVEPNVDRSLVMALVIVHGLMNHIL